MKPPTKEEFISLSEPPPPEAAPDEWLTMREIMVVYGLSEMQARRRVRRLLEAGQYQMRKFPERKKRRIEMVPRYAPVDLQSKKVRSKFRDR